MISVYLGASGGSGHAIGAMSEGQSVTQYCSGIKKEAISAMQKGPAMLSTSETFLKAILRHYKISLENANKQLLLHARARTYYRVGRLLQQWPKHEVAVLGVCVITYIPYSK